MFVETNGLYSFRVIYRVYRDSVANSLEWFSLDPANPATHLLINDTVVGAVKSYRALTVPTRPYVKSVSPAQDASGVLPLAPISVVLANATNITPVLKVNGSTVSLHGHHQRQRGHVDLYACCCLERDRQLRSAVWWTHRQMVICGPVGSPGALDHRRDYCIRW